MGLVLGACTFRWLLCLRSGSFGYVGWLRGLRSQEVSFLSRGFYLNNLLTMASLSTAGVGGLAVGPMTQALIDLYGWRWALRITGIIAGSTIGISGFVLQSRFELVKTRSKLFDVTFFKDYRFVLLYCSFFIQQFGFFVAFNYLPSFAINAGMTSSQGALALGLANAASAVGRIFIGAFADKMGYVNAYTLCLLVTPIWLLCTWPFATSFGILVLFGVVFGFTSGGFISLFPNVMLAIFGIEKREFAVMLFPSCLFLRRPA